MDVVLLILFFATSLLLVSSQPVFPTLLPGNLATLSRITTTSQCSTCTTDVCPAGSRTSTPSVHLDMLDTLDSGCSGAVDITGFPSTAASNKKLHFDHSLDDSCTVTKNLNSATLTLITFSFWIRQNCGANTW